VLLVTAHPSPQGAEGLKLIRKPLDLDDFLREVYDLLAPARASELEKAQRKLNEERVEGRSIGPAPARAEFVLYISSASPSSLKALRNMQRLLQEYEPSHVLFRICDLVKDPTGCDEDHIAFTPTLVKRQPGPRTWIVGDLEDSSVVADLLSYAGVEKRL
jgi:two-component system response regulator GlrR